MQYKKISLLILFACCQAVVLAQSNIGLRLFQVRPLDASPMPLGNTISGELTLDYPFPNNDRLRGRGSVGFIPYKIRFSEIPTYAVQTGGGSTMVFEGTLRQEKFNTTYLTVGLDFNVINQDEFRIYVGAGVGGGTYRSVYKADTPGISSRNADLSGGHWGYTGRAGVAHQVAEIFDVFIESSYTRFNYSEIGWAPFMDIGLGIRYINY